MLIDDVVTDKYVFVYIYFLDVNILGNHGPHILESQNIHNAAITYPDSGVSNSEKNPMETQ